MISECGYRFMARWVISVKFTDWPSFLCLEILSLNLHLALAIPAPDSKYRTPKLPRFGPQSSVPCPTGHRQTKSQMTATETTQHKNKQNVSAERFGFGARVSLHEGN